LPSSTDSRRAWAVALSNCLSSSASTKATESIDGDEDELPYRPSGRGRCRRPSSRERAGGACPSRVLGRTPRPGRYCSMRRLRRHPPLLGGAAPRRTCIAGRPRRQLCTTRHPREGDVLRPMENGTHRNTRLSDSSSSRSGDIRSGRCRPQL
jgi:hypothetical protein